MIPNWGLQKMLSFLISIIEVEVDRSTKAKDINQTDISGKCAWGLGSITKKVPRSSFRWTDSSHLCKISSACTHSFWPETMLNLSMLVKFHLFKVETNAGNFCHPAQPQIDFNVEATQFNCDCGMHWSLRKKEQKLIIEGWTKQEIS